MEYALVLGGGGGKGAYEIGVWKALREMGYANRFSCVLGTSVGALNGALFCRNNPEMAEQIWLEDLKQEEILPVSFNRIAHAILSGNLAGLFGQDGLKRLLERYLPEVMPDSPYFYVCTSKIGQSNQNSGIIEALFADENYEAEYVKMNGLSRREAIPFLLASAALPVIYSPVRMRGGGGTHRDGGMLARNNVPYLEAIRMGYEKILAVSLINDTLGFERRRIREERRGTKYEDKPLPADNRGVSETLIVCPSVSLGGIGFDGTLDFSPEGAQRRMERGYEDCTQIYRKRIDAFFSDGTTLDA